MTQYLRPSSGLRPVVQTPAVAVMASFGLLVSSTAHAERCGNVSMPARAKVAGKTLHLNGMGIREATIFNVDVYVAGLYVETPSRKASAILDESQAKRIVLHFVRKVERDKMKDAMSKAFEASFGKAGVAEMRPMINKLARGLPSQIEEGTTLMFTYLPNKGQFTHFNGKGGPWIKSSQFARAFFNMWLGRKPPNQSLKNGLLGGKCD